MHTPLGSTQTAAPEAGGCRPRRIAINLRRRPTQRAVLRVNGRRVRSVRRGTRRVRVSLAVSGRAVVTIRQGRRTLDRRVYRVCTRR